MNYKYMAALAALALLSGCAAVRGLGSIGAGPVSTPETLQRASASTIGQNIAPEEVTVSDIHRSATTVRWLANTPKGHYSCSADDMVRRPYCVKQ